MTSYQQVIQDEFLRRNSRNSRYSMRGFAKDLGISQSFLCQVLGRKRKLSSGKAIALAEKLKLNKISTELFLNLVRFEESKDPLVRGILLKSIDRTQRKQPKFRLLSEDVFNVVSEWHHFPLLELTTLPNFKCDPRWIAKKLGITVLEAKTSVEKLQRVGLLSLEKGQLKKTTQNYLFENVPSQAIRMHHLQGLGLAEKALSEQEMNQREFFTLYFPTDPKKLPEAKKRIKEFSENLMAEMEEHDPRAVYKLAVQLFRVDREEK